MTFRELLNAIETRYGADDAVELLRIGERQFNKIVDSES